LIKIHNPRKRESESSLALHELPFVQVWCDVASREEYGMATSDGGLVFPLDIDMDPTHYQQVPVIQGVLIPLSKGTQRREFLWKTEYCELCRKARLFRPMDGYTFTEGVGWPENTDYLDNE
jgi:hypothetical protein